MNRLYLPVLRWPGWKRKKRDGRHRHVTGWVATQISWLFSPRKIGEDSHFWLTFFELGWLKPPTRWEETFRDFHERDRDIFFANFFWDIFLKQFVPSPFSDIKFRNGIPPLRPPSTKKHMSHGFFLRGGLNVINQGPWRLQLILMGQILS